MAELPVASGRSYDGVGKNEFPLGGCPKHFKILPNGNKVYQPLMTIGGQRQCPRCYQEMQGDTRQPDQRGKEFVVQTPNVEGAFKTVKRRGPDGKLYEEQVYDKAAAKRLGLKAKVIVRPKGLQPVPSNMERVVPGGQREKAPVAQSSTDLRSGGTIIIGKRLARILRTGLSKMKIKNLDDAEDLILFRQELEKIIGGK